MEEYALLVYLSITTASNQLRVLKSSRCAHPSPCHSGLEVDSELQSFVIAMNSLAYGALVFWEPASSRFAMSYFKRTHFDMTATSVYPPAHQAGPNAEDVFYNKLQDLVSHISKRNIHLTAHIRSTEEYAHQILERFVNDAWFHLRTTTD